MQIYADTLYPDSSHPFLYNFHTGLTAKNNVYTIEELLWVHELWNGKNV